MSTLTHSSVLRQGRRFSRGFVATQIIAGLLVAAVLAGSLGYVFLANAKSNSTAQLRTQSGHLLEQAKYTLTTETSDTDADGYPESPAGTTAYTGGDGWEIPSTSAAPKTDAWGSKFKYCAWDNGSTNSSAGRLTGDSPSTTPAVSQSSVVFAVISAGPNKTIETSCAQAKNNSPQGDDGLRTMIVSQVVQGVGGTAFLGDPVNFSDLANLPAPKPGQIRVAKDTGISYVNKNGCAGASCWIALAGSGGGSGATAAANFAALNSQACTPGQLGVTTNNNFLFVCNSSNIWQVATSVGTSSTLAVSTTSAQVTASANVAMSTTTAFTVSGGTAPYTYSVSPSLPSPVVADTSTNSTYKLSSNNVAMPSSLATNNYTVTVTDSVGFSKQVALNLQIANVSDGYAARGYATPAVIGAAPASCPAGWVGVPAMRIPADFSGGSRNVAAFCVMQFPAVLWGGGVATATLTNSWSSSLPYTSISWTNAVNGCIDIPSGGPYLVDANGVEVQSAHLIYDSQWLAIAHNMAMVGANWEDGSIGMTGGTNRMYMGLSDGSLSTPQPANQAANDSSLTGSANVGKKRGKQLTTGAVIYDIGGNIHQFTYDDFDGTGTYPNSIFSQAMSAAPFISTSRGMGYYYSPTNLGTTQPPSRSGSYLEGSSAGPFMLYSPGSTTGSYNNFGFRCAK